MSAISGYINQIQNAVYGEQVRTAIINALQACYSDVENPDLQSAAFYAAILEAYDQGVLDIIEVTNVSQMTNQNIIYRYMGTQAGYTANTLYYYNGTMWAPIGSGVREAATAALMTDTGAIYKYTGTESGFIQNALYYYNGTEWAPISPPTDKFLNQSNKAADALVTGNAFKELFGIVSTGDIIGLEWNDGYISGTGNIVAPTSSGEKYSSPLFVTNGTIIKISLAGNNQEQWAAVAYYDDSNTFISRETVVNNVTYTYADGSSTAPNNARYAIISFRAYGGNTSISVSIPTNTYEILETIVSTLSNVWFSKDSSALFLELASLLGKNTEPTITIINGDRFQSGQINNSTNTGYAANTQRISLVQAVNGLKNGDIVTIEPTVSSGITAMGVQGYKTIPGATVADAGWTEKTAWPATITIDGDYKDIKGLSITFSGGTNHNNDITNESVSSVVITISSSAVITPEILVLNHDDVVKGIAHRGFSTIAPENTLPAYKLAKTNGFSYAECDLQLTSDDVPVLIHDATINRTSNGTGNVSSYTFEQLQTYDFGAWKSASYAGTKIPSFEQFVVLCKRIGLNPYIELKTESAWNQTKIDALVDTLERYSMKENATFISFSKPLLELVKTKDSSIRLGYVVNSISTTAITDAQALKTTENEVFLDTNAYTSETLAAAISAGIPVEMWYGDTTDANIITLDSYITGVTNNSRLPGAIIYNASISD